jgi:small redox-active disulfide protein 2
MQIQVLGSGCNTCKNLFELTQKALAELSMDDEVEYITDVSKIVEMGIMTSPVLAIDGKAVVEGSTTNIEKIKDLIMSQNK